MKACRAQVVLFLAVLSVASIATAAYRVEISAPTGNKWMICPAGDGSEIFVTAQLINESTGLTVDPSLATYAEAILEGTQVPCNMDHYGASYIDYETDTWYFVFRVPAGLDHGYFDLCAGPCEKIIVNIETIYGVGFSSIPALVSSPDLNGDTLVNMTDTVLFVQMYTSGVFDRIIDFDGSGTFNLSDWIIYQQHVSHDCF